jgi:pSer/pThr/pTyr-binding forkhead associated (FHA) protein
MAKAKAMVRRDGGPEREIALPEGGDWPIFIGSGADCAIALDSPEVAPRQARLDWLSNHIFLTAVATGPVSIDGKPLSLGKETRVDSNAFQLGPFEIWIEY